MGNIYLLTLSLWLALAVRSAASPQDQHIEELFTLRLAPTVPASDLTSAEIKDRFILSSTGVEEHDTVSSVLRLIDSQRKNCTPGTELELEGVVDQYGVKKFSGEAQIAVNRANLLTRIWKHSRAIFTSTDAVLRNQTEYLLYAAVRTMVELSENIFSAGNCYDWYRYPHYDLFCPFSHRMPTGPEILTKDLSVAYEYSDEMEWFGRPKEKGNAAIARSRHPNASEYDHVRKGQQKNASFLSSLGI
ncbi:hypothetical protein BV898_16753 [Hypsibius exemplaris]|uniref:Uncharacterized protein n=1 Tax=Hypsibius exemplaris TaxID=2072580 RepID=A0A9X6RLT3_HYPEX|nr:hypothetical protein BV898_16753 [Hypsibius exemplaris]